MDNVLPIIERSNQRGGRMLSIVDLICAGTLTAAQAGLLAARVLDGASFLIGARPGGAGKTTVMGALLGLLPAGTTVHLAVEGGKWRESRPGECLVAYEIGAGGYDAYIWGDALRAFCRFGALGRRIVSNLHADTPEEARAQLVQHNGVAESDFLSFGIFVPIRVSNRLGRAVRTIERIFAAGAGGWREVEQNGGRREREYGKFFERCRDDDVTAVDAVRQRWLRFVGDNAT